MSVDPATAIGAKRADLEQLEAEEHEISAIRRKMHERIDRGFPTELLIQQERVICTPHVGAYTAESVDRAMSDAVENILRVLKLSLTETG